MNFHLFATLRRARWIAVAVLGSCLAAQALALPQALDNDELSEVSGGEGVSIIADINVNASRVAHSFKDRGVTTHAVMDDVGGGMLVGGLTIDIRNKPDASGDTYIDIGMPGFVAFKKFGFSASAVQTNAQAAIAPNQNLGGVQLNGTGAMTGHFLMWAK